MCLTNFQHEENIDLTHMITFSSPPGQVLKNKAFFKASNKEAMYTTVVQAHNCQARVVV